MQQLTSRPHATRSRAGKQSVSLPMRQSLQPHFSCKSNGADEGSSSTVNFCNRRGRMPHRRRVTENQRMRRDQRAFHDWVFGRIASAVIWSDATGTDGEQLVPIDPRALTSDINANPLLVGGFQLGHQAGGSSGLDKWRPSVAIVTNIKW